MKCFKCCATLTNDMTKDYYEPDIVFSNDKDSAKNAVRDWYENTTTDYIHKDIEIEEVKIENGLVIPY